MAEREKTKKESKKDGCVCVWECMFVCDVRDEDCVCTRVCEKRNAVCEKEMKVRRETRERKRKSDASGRDRNSG